MPKLTIDVDKRVNERVRLASQILRIKEEEVVKNILTRGSEEQVNNMLNELSTLYLNDVISEKELEKILGEKLTLKIKNLKKITERGFEDVKRWVS